MLYKIIDIDEYFQGTQEKSVSLLSIGDNILKTASSEAMDYLKTFNDLDSNYAYVLVLAMGATEWYGPNKRADGWPEKPVPGAVKQGETLLDRYKTFETNAKVYEHHINKDPNKSIGKVIKAFYNLKMHRVELVLALDKAKAREHVARLKDGVFIPWSMGAKVPFDQCSICGNRASNTSQYCVHMKNMPNKILEDGRKVFVWNINPTFIDISAVISPADKTAYTIMVKAASAQSMSDDNIPSAFIGEKVADFARKVAFLGKFSDLYKKLTGMTIATDDNITRSADMVRKIFQPKYEDNRLTDDEINDLANRYSLKEILRGTLRSNLLPLNHEDFIKVFLTSNNAEDLYDRDLVNKFKILEPFLLEHIKDKPFVVDKIRKLLGLSKEDYDPMNIDYELNKKAYVEEYLQRSTVPRAWQPDFPEAFKTLEITDPTTGRKKKTYTGAATLARMNIGEQQLKAILGATLAGGLLYKLMAGPRLMKILLLPPAIYGGYKLTKHITEDPKDLYTIPGYDYAVPEYTEFQGKQKSASDPIENSYLFSLPAMLGDIPKCSYNILKSASCLDVTGNEGNIFYKIGDFILNIL